MRYLIATVAALSLLMHALVGCCWHHQHVELAASCDETQLLPVICGGHVHSHGDDGHDHDHDAESPADHRHSGDDGCGEETCQFVKVDASSSPSPLDGPVMAVVETLAPLSLGESRCDAGDSSARRHFAGVPLHLGHQVLVI